MNDRPTPDDTINGLKHIADDHPCCSQTILLAADMIRQIERQRDDWAKKAAQYAAMRAALERDFKQAEESRTTNASLLERAIDDRDQALRDRWKWESELSEVKRQRDELLEFAEYVFATSSSTRLRRLAKEAIAAVKGGDK